MNETSDIAHIVQLAVAPVFLIAGIGAILNVVTSRLGRVVDRARFLERALKEKHGENDERRIRAELAALDRRMVTAQRAIYLCSLAALLVCVVVATLFLSTLAHLNFGALVALMFVGAMVCLIGGLSLFLVEISIATRTLRVRAELFVKDRTG